MNKMHGESTHHKAKIREEINQQVKDFLRQGGRIDVITSERRPTGNATGNAWPSVFDSPPKAQ